MAWQCASIRRPVGARSANGRCSRSPNSRQRGAQLARLVLNAKHHGYAVAAERTKLQQPGRPNAASFGSHPSALAMARPSRDQFNSSSTRSSSFRGMSSQFQDSHRQTPTILPSSCRTTSWSTRTHAGTEPTAPGQTARAETPRARRQTLRLTRPRQPGGHRH